MEFRNHRRVQPNDAHAEPRSWRSQTPSPAHLAAATGLLLVLLSLAGMLVATSASAAPLAVAQTPATALAAGTTLGTGQQLTSPDGRFRLVLQADGNLVEYGARALWSAGTFGSRASILAVQRDGNVVLYDTAGRPLWSTNTFSTAVSALRLGSDASLVLADAGGGALWAVHPDPATLATGQLLLPGTGLQSTDSGYLLMFQSDGNLVLYATGGYPVWSSGTFSSQPRFVAMQSDGNLVIYAGNGAQWATGTAGFTTAPALPVLVLGSDAIARVQSVASPNAVPVVAWESPSRTDTLLRGQILRAGEHLTTAAGKWQLVMQADGNLVRYGSTGARWATDTFGAHPFLAMQSDGNLVLYADSGVLWSTYTSGSAAILLQVSDGDTSQVLAASGAALWSDGLPNWAALARCESGGNPRAVNPAGYYGLYQFDLGTWVANGGTGNPIDASPAEQLRIAKRLFLARGPQPWPVCGLLL